MPKPVKWELPPREPNKQALRTGEPLHMPLFNFYADNSQSLRTDLNLGCCACGYRHQYAFEVARYSSGKWWLTMLPFAIEGTAPYKVIRKKPRAKPKKKPRRKR